MWRVNELQHFIPRLSEGSIRALNLLVLYSYFSWCVCVCVCVPAYWPSRVCGAEWGAEERWSMGAWRVAAEGSWWSSATRTASCLCTDACRCCAGTYSNATGATSATVCVTCGAGESRMPQARHVMPAYPIIYIYPSSWFTPYIYIYIFIYICIYVCVCIYICIYKFSCLSLSHTHRHTHTHTNTHTHTHVTSIYLSIFLSMFLSIYLSIYPYPYIYISISIYMLYFFLLSSCFIYNICIICLWSVDRYVYRYRYWVMLYSSFMFSNTSYHI